MHPLSILVLLFSLAPRAVESNPNVVIGIDLGTTYSCVAVYRAGRVDIIPNDQGNRVTPSWVAFQGDERLVGDTAKHMFHTIPSQTMFGIKRLLGRSFDDPEVQDDIQYWPAAVVNKNGKPAVQVKLRGQPKTFMPQEMSAMVLARMKETAEAYLGHNVTQAVITVPAYFNDEQRQATKDAGQIAGLNVLRLLNEPTAAALAHGLGAAQESGTATTIVYDLGGGTFDVSLLRVHNGVFEVLATSGITHLGGEDFDKRVIDYFIGKFKKETASNIRDSKRSMAKLKREVERAKHALSAQLTVQLAIDSLENGNDFSGVLTRAKFEELNLDLFQRTLEPVSKVLADAQLTVHDVDHVVLVGGSTRIPKIRELLRGFFNGKEPEMGINPDEAVAYGAAIQGSILSGVHDLNETVTLVDVCPFTLGVATSGGVFDWLIERNTPIPVQKSEVFSTATDNQQSVLIQIYQGEDDFTTSNTLLGTFKLMDIPMAARGVPQIEVKFSLDANGILTVSAHDKDSGNSESITITRETEQLGVMEISRMVHEARGFAAKDESIREQSQLLNELQHMISTKRIDHAQTAHSESYQLTLDFLNAEAEWAESSGISASTEELKLRMLNIEHVTQRIESIASRCPSATDTSPPANFPMSGNKYSVHNSQL